MPFSPFGLADPLLQAASQYASPTPVQAEAIPAVLTGGDVIATAQTGSGKTVAFVLPLLHQWLEADPQKRRFANKLILVPTRELAAQVREVVQECTQHFETRVKVVSAIGGVSINPQMMALRGGADFIVATPGRLLDLVDSNAVSLAEVSTLVLDEADRMLALGFADELGRILALLPKRRQNLLFSATFSRALEGIASEFLTNPKRIDIQATPVEEPDIQQRAIQVDKDKRAPLLRHLIAQEGWERVIVFVAKQYSAEHVADKLRRNGIDAGAFHGDLSQGARKTILADFQDSVFQVMVATDLAARGLDIMGLPAVVNYDLPRSADDYIHRIGRTGRAGKSGMAVSFITAESQAHFALIEKRHGFSLDREQLAEFVPTEVAPPVPKGTGGIKGRRKSKKDKLREAAARARSGE